VTNEQKAASGVKEILRLKKRYIVAKDRLKASQAANDPPQTQVDLLRKLYRAATGAFNSVDKCISESDLLGANRSEFWAIDLAGTAVNTLDHIPRCYQSLWKDADRLEVERPKPSPKAFLAMQASAKTYFPVDALSLEKRFNDLGLPTAGFKDPPRMNTRYKDWEKITMISIVVVFVLIMLAIGIWVKQLNNFNIFLFRTVLALIGGAFGAIFIPGLLRVKKFGVTAAGAAAFFAIIFFFNPPALVKNTVETGHPSLPPSATP
jgi:hypothetical protein